MAAQQSLWVAHQEGHICMPSSIVLEMLEYKMKATYSSWNESVIMFYNLLRGTAPW